MPDDARSREPADHSRVNTNDPAEVKYWRRQYGCTEQQLRQAVSAVGESPAKIRQYFKNKSRPNQRQKIGYD